MVYMVKCNSDHFRRMNGKPSNLPSVTAVDSDVPERLASFEFSVCLIFTATFCLGTTSSL